MASMFRCAPDRGRARPFTACVLGALCAVLAAVPTWSAGPAAAAATRGSPTTVRLDVVGGPVAAEGSAVVITVDAAHNLRLEGIAPDTGRVLWSHPYGMSAINPGLAPALYVIDNVVVDLAPTDGRAAALVDVDGVNATTGALAWKGPQDLLVADTPSTCAQGHDFCLTGYENNATTAMVALDPATGRTVRSLAGPLEAVDRDVYQTDAKTPTLEALSPSGSVTWTKTFRQLFGSNGYDPAYGWDFLAFGSTEIGTAGATNADHSEGFDDARTVGIALASGGTEWSLPGQFQCGGSLGFLSPSFNCIFSGTLARTHKRGSIPSYAGLHVALQGFDAATGAVSWTHAVRGVDSLVTGDTSFLDASHLMVNLNSGTRVLLNVATGTTARIGRHEALWCAHQALFKVEESKDLNPSGQRPGVAQFSPCTAGGSASVALPKSNPTTVGVTVDGVFLWASTRGLERRVVGAARGTA
jgi:hypothetical protein